MTTVTVQDNHGDVRVAASAAWLWRRTIVSQRDASGHGDHRSGHVAKTDVPAPATILSQRATVTSPSRPQVAPKSRLVTLRHQGRRPGGGIDLRAPPRPPAHVRSRPGLGRLFNPSQRRRGPGHHNLNAASESARPRGPGPGAAVPPCPGQTTSSPPPIARASRQCARCSRALKSRPGPASRARPARPGSEREEADWQAGEEAVRGGQQPGALGQARQQLPAFLPAVLQLLRVPPAPRRRPRPPPPTPPPNPSPTTHAETAAAPATQPRARTCSGSLGRGRAGKHGGWWVGGWAGG